MKTPQFPEMSLVRLMSKTGRVDEPVSGSNPESFEIT
jgi:hypothetical protein